MVNPEHSVNMPLLSSVHISSCKIWFSCKRDQATKPHFFFLSSVESSQTCLQQNKCHWFSDNLNTRVCLRCTLPAACLSAFIPAAQRAQSTSRRFDTLKSLYCKQLPVRLLSLNCTFSEKFIVLFCCLYFCLFRPLLCSLPLFLLASRRRCSSLFTPRPPPLPQTHKLTSRAKPLTQPPVPLLHPHRFPHTSTIYLLPAAIHAEEDSCLNVYARSYFLFLRAPNAFQRKLCSPHDGAAS